MIHKQKSKYLPLIIQKHLKLGVQGLCELCTIVMFLNRDILLFPNIQSNKNKGDFIFCGKIFLLLMIASPPHVSGSCWLLRCGPTSLAASSGSAPTRGEPRRTQCGIWREWLRAPSPFCPSAHCSQVGSGFKACPPGSRKILDAMGNRAVCLLG